MVGPWFCIRKQCWTSKLAYLHTHTHTHFQPKWNRRVTTEKKSMEFLDLTLFERHKWLNCKYLDNVQMVFLIVSISHIRTHFWFINWIFFIEIDSVHRLYVSTCILTSHFSSCFIKCLYKLLWWISDNKSLKNDLNDDFSQNQNIFRVFWRGYLFPL